MKLTLYGRRYTQSNFRILGLLRLGRSFGQIAYASAGDDCRMEEKVA